MSTGHRLTFAALVLLGLWSPPLSAPPGSYFRTEADQALTQWAMARFDRYHLDLPAVTIAFHDGKESCAGHFGLHRAGEISRIDICGFNWDRFVPAAKRTILHELGHAWAHHTLTEEVRQRFVVARGLPTWGDDQIPWSKQGAEQAAEILAWGLMDVDFLVSIDGEVSEQALAQGYFLLTGTLPPKIFAPNFLDRSMDSVGGVPYC